MTILHKIAAMLVILLVMTTSSWSDQTEIIQPCIQAPPVDQLEICKQMAHSLSSNEQMLNLLGSRLESEMRYGSAVAVYEIASRQSSHNKELLQSLIRVRAAWRKQKAIGQLYAPDNDHVQNKSLNPAGGRQSDVDDCYNHNQQQGLTACRKLLAERGNDAELQERVGDILKSMQRTKSALLAYKISLRLNPANPELKRKRDALADLAGVSASVNTRPQDNEPAAGHNQGPAQNNNSIAGRQIELLDRLYRQNILSREDYELEKRTLIARADALQDGNAKITRSARSRLRSIDGGSYHALIIGNNKYESRDYPDLLTAVNDAKKIESILKRRYGFKTRLLLNADRYSIVNAMSNLRKSLKPEDKLLVYYAGHGILDEATNQGYWLPVDAESGSVANWVSANDVTDALIGLQARHALVIADSCFSASLLRTAGQTRIDERDALLIRLGSKRSRTVLTSGGLEPVQDDGGGKHSVFANALISALEENDSLLEAGKLFIQVRDKVILNAEQTPQYAPITRAGHDGGDFIFIPT